MNQKKGGKKRGRRKKELKGKKGERLKYKKKKKQDKLRIQKEEKNQNQQKKEFKNVRKVVEERRKYCSSY